MTIPSTDWMVDALAKRSNQMKVLILAVVLPLLAGCASTGPIEGPVRLGQIAAVDGPRVRPDHVVEDSRCPIGVPCVWAGRLIVRATVFGGGWSRQLDFTLGVPVNVADGSLVLAAATPLKQPARPSDKALPYRFTFSFHGGR